MSRCEVLHVVVRMVRVVCLVRRVLWHRLVCCCVAVGCCLYTSQMFWWFALLLWNG